MMSIYDEIVSGIWLRFIILRRFLMCCGENEEIEEIGYMGLVGSGSGKVISGRLFGRFLQLYV